MADEPTNYKYQFNRLMLETAFSLEPEGSILVFDVDELEKEVEIKRAVYNEAVKELDHFKNLSPEQRVQACKDQNDSDRRSHDYFQDVNQTRYGQIRIDEAKAVLKLVQDWQSPTPEHTALKAVALTKAQERLQSVEQNYGKEPFIPTPIKQWFESKLRYLEGQVAIAHQAYLSARERMNSQSDWMRQVNDSLRGDR